MTDQTTALTGVVPGEQLGLTVAEVFAKMRKHRPNWNAYGQSRESAAALATRCALELASEQTARALAAERERCAKVCDDNAPDSPTYFEIAERLRECAAEIRGA